MERLTERTADGILVKENHVENGLRTFYQCFGEKPNDKYTNCDGGYCAIEKLAAYEDAEEQGLILRLPCNEVWFICDKGTKYATVMSKSINDLTVYEIRKIDKDGRYWSSKKKAEAKMAEMEGAE